MPLKVYIVYGSSFDQVTALRLQALGAVNGMVVYVPPAYTREQNFSGLDPNAEHNLTSADVVLGVVTTYPSDSSLQELNLAKTIGKRTIVLADDAYVSKLDAAFPGSVFAIDLRNPVQSEHAIVEFLKQTGLEEENKRMLIALGTLALGLLLFAPQD